MDTDKNIADELLTLIDGGYIRDFNRVTEIVSILHKRTKLKGNDFLALEDSKPYIRKMQELLGQQN